MSQSTSRREFLRTTGAAAALVSAGAAPAAAQSKQRPNILFIIADDWGFGHAGAYGCKWVNTPAFDRIATVYGMGYRWGE